ncbi:MAG: methyl-accepting chemotaxis protein [Paenibacillaceae bacterium]|nr:methyl-accepting chemotaxis protein [Paenibacillaceae bacterium]
MRHFFPSGLSFQKNIRIKIIAFFLIMVLSITMTLAYILYQQSYKAVTSKASETAYQTVSQSSKYIDVEKFITLTSPEDENTDYYKKERDNLIKIREITGARHIFTLRKTSDGKFMYVVDGSPEGELSHIGDMEESALCYEQSWSGIPYTDQRLNFVEGWGIYISSYYPIKDSQGTVVGIMGADFDAESIYNEMEHFKKVCLLILVIFTAIITLAGFLFSDKISRSIKRSSDFAKELAEFNLQNSISKKELRKKDEFGVLANSLENIRNNFQVLIGKINSSSSQVALTSNQLTAASTQSARAAEEVSHTIHEIASRADDQMESTMEGALKTTQLGDIIDNNLSLANHINSAITVVTESINDGLKEMDNLSEITAESNSANEKIYDLVTKTNESSHQISAASSLISSIALQTRLLALNASVEAARAGQAGKGFSVVASEIKKLAALSADSSKNIEEIVSDLQINASNAVDIMERIKCITTEQTHRVENSRATYQAINQAMEKSKNASVQLNDTGKEMYDMKNTILALIENLTHIAKQNSQAAGDVNQSMEEEAGALEEIAASSDLLSQLAKDLHDMILEFKI